MNAKPTVAISEHFASLEDPRVERTKLHQLLDIIVIAICAVICGADDWVEVELFGNAKLAWLRTFLELPNGIPSHDTFGRVFARLNAEQFQQCFLAWIQAVSEVTRGQVIALDGKVLRGSCDRVLGKAGIDMVSAWATANHLVLGQVKVDDKSNEITAIPKLLQMLEIAGCIVTIDALGCQTEIAQAIVERDADYVLAVKENQGHLMKTSRACLMPPRKCTSRTCRTIMPRPPTKIMAGWKSASVGPSAIPPWSTTCVTAPTGPICAPSQSRRRAPGQRRDDDEARYFISSLDGDAQRLLNAVRSHWGIENALHWVLDIAFDEDHHRLRKDNGPANFAVLRHIALNLLKQEKSVKAGIKAKRLKAGWDEPYLLKVLFGLGK